MRRRTAAMLALLAVPAFMLPGQAKTISLTREPARLATAVDRSLPDDAIRAARGYLGVPYVTGGVSPSGMDCSGLVYLVLREATGMNVSRGVEGLYHAGTEESYPLHLGDLLFFDTDSTGAPSIPSHVGIYAGNGRFIHAASEGAHTGVIVSSLDNPYYHERFLGARRVIPWRAPVLDVILSDTPSEVATASPFPSREKMTIRVINHMSGGGPMDLTISKDGKTVKSERIAPSDFGPALVPLTPGVGTWEVRVNRLFKGRELGRVTFRVEE